MVATLNKKLFTLVQSRNFKECSELIISTSKKTKFDPNIIDETQNYLIQYAVMYGSLELVTTLIKMSCLIDVVDHDGRCLLYYCIKFNHLHIFKALLHYNSSSISADIMGIPDNNGRLPIHHAIQIGTVDSFQELMSNASSIHVLQLKNIIASSNIIPPLHFAIMKDRVDIITAMLQWSKTKTIPFDVNQLDREGQNALALACSLNNTKMVQYCLELKIPHAPSFNQSLPIYSTVENNNLTLFKALLPHCDLTYQNHRGDTLLHHALLYRQHEIVSLILSASTRDSTESMYNLVNINGNTPLHIALIHNVFDVKTIMSPLLTTLVIKSILNIQNSNGDTAFHHIVHQWNDTLQGQLTTHLSKKIINPFIKNYQDIAVIDMIDALSPLAKKCIIDIIIEATVSQLVYSGKSTTDATNLLIQLAHIKDNGIIDEPLVKKLKKEYKLKTIKATEPSTVLKTIVQRKIEKKIPVIKSQQVQSILPDETTAPSDNLFTGMTIDILTGLVQLSRKCGVVVGPVIDTNPVLVDHYGKIGIYKNPNIEFFNVQIHWVYHTLIVPTWFKSFKSLCTDQHRCWIMMISIEGSGPVGHNVQDTGPTESTRTSYQHHSNVIVYDRLINRVERFEPFGHDGPADLYYHAKKLDQELSLLFKSIDPAITYASPKQYLPKISFQALEIMESTQHHIGDPHGYCSVWGLWYAQQRSAANIDKNINSLQNFVDDLLSNVKLNRLSFKHIVRQASLEILPMRTDILAPVTISQWFNLDVTAQQHKSIVGKLKTLFVKSTT